MVVNANSSLDGLLGEGMMSSIKTGNAITTAIVIAMFIYLFIKLNIQFIVRQFVLIIFTVFTPVALSIWIVNRNATAISIWAGQIITNVFMQFIYCFLFLMYLTFLPSRRRLGCKFNLGNDDFTACKYNTKFITRFNK